MKKEEARGLAKWNAFLAGQDVGPMVSPLCDDWSLDVPYQWPLARPEPFPKGHRQHGLSMQMAMAATCGWDPTFLCMVDFLPRSPQAVPQVTTDKIDGGTRTTSTYRTPYGDVSCITEQKLTQHVVKPWLETKEDYHRMAWVIRQQCEFDEDESIRQGLACREGIAGMGPMGTWSNPPTGLWNHDNMYYHLADWPEACEEMHQACKQQTLKQLSTLRKAGFDYLFYCVDGTEWISPDFFRQYVLDDTREILHRWRELGGWILWHSCGKIARFVEEGFYNELKPEVFETVSEPPVGSLPDLAWGRSRLDKAIATKGNMPLNILLQGTPEDVRQDVRRIKAQTAGYRHIVGLSDDILKNTPLANARAFVEEARLT